MPSEMKVRFGIGGKESLKEGDSVCKGTSIVALRWRSVDYGGFVGSEGLDRDWLRSNKGGLPGRPRQKKCTKQKSKREASQDSKSEPASSSIGGEI